MKTLFKYVFICTLPMYMVSCAVTNNLYVNNPIPMGKGNADVYLGIGTGIVANRDTSNTFGPRPENSTNKISTSAALSFGLQCGITNQTDLRVAACLPGIIGGFGLRAGIQHSFFDPDSPINMALGTDLGIVVSKDSIKIFDTKIPINKVRSRAINADFFLPVSLKINNDFKVVLTPRYSFNTFYRLQENNTQPFRFGYPALSLGIRIKKFYLETTAICFENNTYPHFGIAWLVNSKAN